MPTTPAKSKYSYRPIPQLSASQMAEFIASDSPTRRRTIIREAQFPPTSVVTQYRGAREGLVKFLSDGTRSPRHFARAIVDLDDRSKASPSTWVKADCLNSIEAIERFQAAYNRMLLRKLDCRIPSGKKWQISDWPTTISVSFDLTLHKPQPTGPDKFGAVQFVFGKGEAKTKKRAEQCANMAGLIYTFCQRNLKGFGVADPALCIAVDVFSGTEYRCPGTFTRKLRHVEDSCHDIAALWHTIPPPSDYDGPKLKRP
jgi:hypothetical protein